MAPRDLRPSWGEAVPQFEARTATSDRFNFFSLGGRFIALAFLGHGREPTARAFLERVAAAALPREDERCVRYAVSQDEADLDDPLTTRAFPPCRVFVDPDGAVARLWGVLRHDEERQALRHTQTWFLIDPNLRVYATGNLRDPEGFLAAIRALPPTAEAHSGVPGEPWAPVLLVPRILEPALCRTLIELYDSGEPEDSGFMRTREGRTVPVLDPGFKRRRDVVIHDEALRVELCDHLRERLFPQIEKAFQYKATRIERWIVACYDEASRGFFRPHRDDTTAGTAHRRFAVTINLNAEGYDGGELRFPEYGSRSYRAPTGGAIVFSCKLLHEALPVTRGTRYATLPFLYDEAAAKIRQENLKYLDRPDRSAAPAAAEAKPSGEGPEADDTRAQPAS